MGMYRGVDPERLAGEQAVQFERHVRMHEVFGAGPEVARRRALDDLIEAGLVARPVFDQRVDRFKDLGLSETEARVAARGRDYATDEGARRGLEEAAGPGVGVGGVAPTRYVTVGGRRMTVQEFVESGPTPPQNRPRAAESRAAGPGVHLSESAAPGGRVRAVECGSCKVTHLSETRCPKCERR